MPFEVDADTRDLEREWAKALDAFSDELADAVDVSCKAGAKYSQNHHPYTDRTYHLTDTTFGKVVHRARYAVEGVLGWVQDYAKYVDQGTSRSRAYPFVQAAVAYTEKALHYAILFSVIPKAFRRFES